MADAKDIQITPEFLDSLDTWIRESMDLLHLNSGAKFHADNVRYNGRSGDWEVATKCNLAPEAGVILRMSTFEFHRRINAWTDQKLREEKQFRENIAQIRPLSEEEDLEHLFEERP